ncbi:MAG: hypothetical protein KF703_15545, partial [Actinobacteria bacterium]|nr:hypothetical protein [Actinomycetota bacterium]
MADVLDGIGIEIRRERRDHRRRAVALGILVAFVGAGALGAFGVREGRVGRRAPSGLRIAVTYPQIARPGLAVPISVQVSKPGGFDGPIDVAMPTAYLQMLDENGFHPD